MDPNEIPEEVRHLYPNHTAAAARPAAAASSDATRPRASAVFGSSSPNGNDGDDDDDGGDDGYAYYIDEHEEGDEEEEDEFTNMPDDHPLLQDEGLYGEVLAYLMQGHKGSADNSNPVNQMPSSLQRALGGRHVRIDAEPRDIVPGPVQLIDLPVGLALLFDVATDEAFRERWQGRTLEPLKALGEPPAGAEGGGAESGAERRLVPEDGAAPAAASSADGAAPAAAAAAAPAEGDKKEDEEKKDGEGDGGDEDGGGDGHHKKKKRVVDKPPWGGPPKEKPAPAKKYSTLLKPAPRPKVEYHWCADVNAGMLLPGPPQWLPYLGYLCALPPPRPDRCVALYEGGKEHLETLTEKEKAARQKKEEEALAACTFHPEVTPAVKRMPGWKGDMAKFYKDKLEWTKQMERKLQKKKEKKEKDDEEKYVKWEMPAASKKILERRERRVRALAGSGSGADETPARAADRRGVEVVALDANYGADGQSRSVSAYSGGVAAQAADSANAGFTPVTNSHRFRALGAAAGGMQRSASDGAAVGGGGGNGGGDLQYNFTAILDEFAPPEQLVSGELTRAKFLSRMDDDLKGRTERKQQRAIQFLRQQKEKLFDPITGQPLFEPNAAPTIVRQDGQRISFHELSAKEKKDLLRRLKQQKRLDFIPGLARNRTDTHAMGDEEVQEMYKRMLEKVRQGTVRIDRIRRKEDQELTKLFRPTIDKKTAEMIASQGKYRKPVYKLPLPKKPPPPKPAPKPKSCDTKMSSVVERNTVFHATRLDALQKKADEKEQAIKQYTFQPAVSPASNRIVGERRAQWQKEIATLDQRREEARAMRFGGEIHYASEMQQGGSGGELFVPASGLAVAPAPASGLSSASALRPSPSGIYVASGLAAAAAAASGLSSGSGLRPSPSGIYAAQQSSTYYDPAAEQNLHRERSWTRPDARRVASKWYFEAEQPQRKPSPTLLGNRGSGLAAAKRVSGFQQQQQQQPAAAAAAMMQQPAAALAATAAPSGGGVGYEELDAVVGSVLSSMKSGSGGIASPAAQQPTAAAAAYPAAQALKFSSSPNNERSVSEQQRLAALARARQQRSQPTASAAAAAAAPTADESGSGLRLRSILASWDDLERQTSAVLGM